MGIIKRSIIWLVLALTLTSLSIPSVLAATSPPLAGNGEALEIAPPLIYLTVNPGQVITTQIQVRDISSGPLVVSGQENDFVASGDTGNPKIIINNNDQDPYSIKGWIRPMASVLLQPQQIKNIPVIIDVPRDASPGGHYGVYRFSAAPPSTNGKNGVSLSASLGTLMLITVNGKLVENMSLTSFYSSDKSGKKGSLFQSEPIVVNELLKNSGNVHLQPSGTITIKDMFGKPLSVVNINPQPGNVLPASSRLFSQTIDSSILGKRKLFGRYSVDLKVSYGNNHKTLTATLTFWVLPLKLIGGLVIGLIAGFFLLRWLIKRYNQHILDKAQKASSKPRKK